MTPLECVKSKWKIRCPKCGEWATFCRDERNVHFCMECAARFSGLEVMAMVCLQ